MSATQEFIVQPQKNLGKWFEMANESVGQDENMSNIVRQKTENNSVIIENKTIKRVDARIKPELAELILAVQRTDRKLNVTDALHKLVFDLEHDLRLAKADVETWKSISGKKTGEMERCHFLNVDVPKGTCNRCIDNPNRKCWKCGRALCTFGDIERMKRLNAFKVTNKNDNVPTIPASQVEGALDLE